MLKGIKLLACFVFLSTIGKAQDLTKDLQRIMSNIDSTSSMEIEAKVNAYSRKGGSVIYTANTAIYRTADAALTKLGDQEFLITPLYDVKVDHEEKAVLIQKIAPGQANKKTTQKLDMEVSKLLKMLEKGETASQQKIVLVSNQSGKKTYSVTNSPGLKEIRIVLNMTALSIESVTYEFNDKGENKNQYVTVEYTAFNKNTDLTARLKTSQYFTESNGEYVLATRLKGYKIYTEL